MLFLHCVYKLLSTDKPEVCDQKERIVLLLLLLLFLFNHFVYVEDTNKSSLSDHGNYNLSHKHNHCNLLLGEYVVVKGKEILIFNPTSPK